MISATWVAQGLMPASSDSPLGSPAAPPVPQLSHTQWRSLDTCCASLRWAQQTQAEYPAEGEQRNDIQHLSSLRDLLYILWASTVILLYCYTVILLYIL
jgi:hypothetical protein